MNPEIYLVFNDIKEDRVFSFGELKKRFGERTNKFGSSTFYSFLRELTDLGIIKKQPNQKFKVFYGKVKEALK